MNTHYRNNLEAVMQVNKNYTDTEIKKSEERILSIVARNNVDFIDHTDEATYRFTAPANAKLLMLQSIAGNSNKIAPSTPSDDSVARLKTIPDNTYKSQNDYIGGKTVKYNQLVRNGNFESDSGWNLPASTTIENNKAKFSLSQGSVLYSVNRTQTFTDGHKVLQLFNLKTDNPSNINLLRFRYPYVSNLTVVNNTNFNTYGAIGTATSETALLGFQIQLASSITTNCEVEKYICIDLTDKFGAGNEPSDVASAIPLLKANGYKLDGTDTYSTGELKHAVVSGVEYDGNYCNVNDSVVYDARTFQIASNLPAGTYTFKIIDFNDTNTNYAYNLRIGTTILGTKNCNQSLTFTTTEIGNIFIYVNTSLALGYKIMLIKGSTVPSTYIPYVAPITRAIPSEVLADVRYGLGFDNTNYNHLDSDGHLRGKRNSYTFTGNETFLDRGTNQLGLQIYSCDVASFMNYEIPVSNITTIENYLGTTDSIVSIQNGSDTKGIKVFESQLQPSTKVIYFIGYTLTEIVGVAIEYNQSTAFDQDYSQYFDTNWNKVDLDNLYATCEMVVAEPIDMPNKVEYYGTIIHSLATAVKQDGFNVWDEVWETGSLDATNGQELTVNNAIRSKNYISILPNTTYYTKTSYAITSYGFIKCFFDSNNRFISSSNTYDISFTTPINAVYMKFATNGVYGGTYKNDICINISNQDLNGTYKPYKAPITRLLPNSEAKYSWGITDGVRNTRVFCDDECNAVNEGQLDVGNQDLGGLNYIQDISNVFRGAISDLKRPLNGVSLINAICFKYKNANQNAVFGGTSGDMAMSGLDWYDGIQIRNESYTNPTTFKSAMSGVPLFYEKNATGTENIDDFDFSFDCEEGDTFTIIGCELLQCYATYSFLIKEAKQSD